MLLGVRSFSWQSPIQQLLKVCSDTLTLGGAAYARECTLQLATKNKKTIHFPLHNNNSRRPVHHQLLMHVESALHRPRLYCSLYQLLMWCVHRMRLYAPFPYKGESNPNNTGYKWQRVLTDLSSASPNTLPHKQETNNTLPKMVRTITLQELTISSPSTFKVLSSTILQRHIGTA